MQQYRQALPDGVNSVTGTLGSEVIAAGEGVEPLFLVSGIPRGVQTLLGLLSVSMTAVDALIALIPQL